VTPAAMGVAAAVIAVIQGLKRLRPTWPAMLIAVGSASVLAAAFALPVETIGTKFGALPRVPPAPALPPMDANLLMAALPWAISFTLLGAIESLLSAVVADGMTGRQHRSNAELLAQGVANIGSALFGGFCVTGTIARTATNVRAGSRGPVSGMLHALFVLAFMLVAAPLAGFIPLAALAGVLAVVAWNMAEKEEFWHLLKSSRSDALVLVVTFLLVIFRDLTEGIVVGFALGGLVFIRRMSETAMLEGGIGDYPQDGAVRSDRVVYRLHGPWFFGAAARLGSVLDRIADHPRAFVIDLSNVPMIDSSGARSFLLLARKTARKGGQLYIVGARPEVRRTLHAHGLHEPEVRFLPDMDALDADVVAVIPA
jgi:SulP family sulfate permease